MVRVTEGDSFRAPGGQWKYSEGTNGNFYTGMRKQAHGYNSDSGDGEFFTLDASGHTVTARGKIDS